MSQRRSVLRFALAALGSVALHGAALGGLVAVRSAPPTRALQRPLQLRLVEIAVERARAGGSPDPAGGPGAPEQPAVPSPPRRARGERPNRARRAPVPAPLAVEAGEPAPAVDPVASLTEVEPVGVVAGATTGALDGTQRGDGTGAGVGNGRGGEGEGHGPGSGEGALAFGAGMSRPTRVGGRDPMYTREAREARVEGTLLAECVITPSGALEECRLVKSLPHLGEEVLAALRTWRMTPVSLNGRPVRVRYRIPVRMVLR